MVGVLVVRQVVVFEELIVGGLSRAVVETFGTGLLSPFSLLTVLLSFSIKSAILYG